MNINYQDYEQVIKHFWNCSIKNDFNKFNWDEAFDNIKNEMQRRLAENGILSYEDFVEQLEEIEDYSVLDDLQQQTDYIQIATDELRDVILEYKYKRNREQFLEYSSFETLKKTYDKLLKGTYNLSQKEKVFLFDECIHAEHETGLVLDIKPINELREEFEEELKV